jgi:PAS domain S-box-containing protein
MPSPAIIKQKLTDVRNKTLNYTLSVVALLGTVSFFLLLSRAIDFGFNPSFAISAISILVFIAIFYFRHKLSIQQKTILLITFTTLLFGAGLYSFGYLAASKIFILGLPIIVSFISGNKKSFVVLLVMFALYAVFGFLYTHKILEYNFDTTGYIFSPTSWILEGVIILMSCLGILYVSNLFIEIIIENYAKFEKQNKEYQDINQELNCLLDELYESNNRNSALLNAVPDMMFILNHDNQIVDFHSSVPLDDYISKEAFLNKDIRNVLPPIVCNSVETAIKNLKSTGEVQVVSFSLTIGDTLYHFESRLVSYGKDKILAIMRDVTGLKAANDNLQESEERFRIAAESINGIIYTIDKDMNFTLSKGMALCDLKLKPDEVVGMSLADYLNGHESSETTIDAHIRALTGKTVIFESTHNNIIFSTILSPIRNIEGEIKSVVGLSVNITEQKQLDIALRESESKYRLIFDNSPLGIAHFDKDGLITRCNNFFTEIMGLSEEKLFRRNLSNYADRPLFETITSSLNSGNYSFYQGTFTSPFNQRQVPIRARIKPISKNNAVVGGILLIEDLSDKIKHEDLQKQIEIVKESARFKQNFLANMSHEIRTPLTGVMGMIDILEQSELNNQQHEYVGILKQSGENLREIIDQVLDFSKIEAGKISLNKTTIPFQTIVFKAEKLFYSICKKDISFTVETDPRIPSYIVVDETRIMQIINNLISNAVKFTTKGNIHLKTECVSFRDQKCKLKISVSDTGMGIPCEKQQQLFTPFTQVDNNDIRQYEGTGLGLSICKELARLQGGEVGLESKPKIGSTFWFTIMVDFSADHIPMLTEPQLFPFQINSKLKILLAEDQKVNQKVFKILFLSMGFEIQIAENGQEALQMYEPDKFDLILMDIQMPQMDGITATRILRQRYTDLPPIIGLSANAFEGDREKYMKLGFDEYLTKPLKKNDFYFAMASVMGKNSMSA